MSKSVPANIEGIRILLDSNYISLRLQEELEHYDLNEDGYLSIDEYISKNL